MKAKLHCLLIWLLLLAGLVQIQTASAALSLTVTPSAVSNTYVGAITLQIGGLTNGEAVVIKKYLDLNSNGVVDANDSMVRDFQLTAGQSGAMVIGGVTNVNVPFNSSANTNSITTTLNFQNGQFMETLVAQYLFVVTCATGQITNSLVVTNSYAQQFTGTVFSGVNPVPDAVVLLLPPSGPIDNAPTPGTVANNSGVYTLPAPVGTYALAAYKTNFVTGNTTAINLTLSNGQTVTTNLSLIAATESISGQIIDAATSNGLPGVLVVMASSTGEVFCYTDTNGNYTDGVTANQWTVNGEDASVALLGYVGFNKGVPTNASSGSVSNVIIAENKASALFYGYITNNFGNPLPGFQIEAEDINETYDSFGSADANGYYVTGAFGGLSSGDPYEVNLGSDYLPTNYLFSQSPYPYAYEDVNLATNTAVTVDFTATFLPFQVTTILLPGAVNGVAYDQTLAASYGQAPYTWTNISGALPPGLTLATNGVISGTPTANGTFNFTVHVTDAASNTATQALALTVGIPPSAAIQPSNSSVAVTVGSNVTLSVSVSGTGPFSYQWRQNGTNLPNGIITTVAGDQINGYTGNGGPATNAEFDAPEGVAVDTTGNLFIGDFVNNVIRKVGTNGTITTVAGNGFDAGTYNGAYSGDGGEATNAELYLPEGVAVDATGNLFIADSGNSRVRKVGTNGIITTVAGGGTNGLGDGGAATNAEIGPAAVAVDATGNIFIADYAGRIRKVGTNGIITTVAGNGTNGYSGDGGSATNAEIGPAGVAVDATGNIYIAEFGNNRIRKVGTNGIITTVAGNGNPGYGGDGGLAIYAELDEPEGVAVDATGNLFIADNQNCLIREVRTNGIITSMAGNGHFGYGGDGGPAINAFLNRPNSAVTDTSGDLFFVDRGNDVVRKVIIDGPTLVLNNVGTGNAGAYDVVVTSPYGSVTSSVVNVSVTIPGFMLSAPKTSSSKTNFSFQLSGPAGSNYVLQVSTNLLNWSPVSTNTIPVGGTITLSNTMSGNKQFYRAVIP